MNFFVINIVLSFLTLFPLVPDSGKVNCTCRPSPPGGVTECQSGQNAICTASGGVCKGSCISFSNELRPLQYSAELVSAALNKSVSESDLQRDPKGSKNLLDKLLEISKKGETGKVKHGGKEYLVCLGLNEVAKNKLKSASKGLATSILYMSIPKSKRWP
jgi:hypothetical protein